MLKSTRIGLARLCGKGNRGEMMTQSSRGPRDDLRGREGSWVERNLGEGWAEVEPGIFRFTASAKQTGSGIRMSPPVEAPLDDLAESLDPTIAVPATPSPIGRRFGRRVGR